MIDRNVAIILGAGASKPYGFLTGKELVEQAIRDRRTPVLHTIRELGFSVDDYSKFRTTLRNSGLSSIDRFLEIRDDFMDIGKA